MTFTMTSIFQLVNIQQHQHISGLIFQAIDTFDTLTLFPTVFNLTN